MPELRLHNSLTRRRETFAPIDPAHVRLYVCGPTVYDRAHLGNARPVVVFDVLVRLLRRLYPRVTYVRNITDVDDKINARAAETGEPIAAITAATTADFHADISALNALPPDREPRATAHIPDMIGLIERLIEGGHAYEAEGHVLFSVASFPDYGKLSGRSTEELIAGARVDVAPYKRDAGDFVLWKPSSSDLPGWDSPWGRGRPGWHIECSAMAWRYLGETFDLHGGGQDLLFPHHENELAQSCCAFPGSEFARCWLHNGMLLVGGEKMSKSLGNFLTIRDALEAERKITIKKPGEAVRLLLLRTHYRSSLDFTTAALAAACLDLERWYRAIEATPAGSGDAPEQVVQALCDDLNTPLVIAEMHELANRAFQGDAEASAGLRAAGDLLGVLQQDPKIWFRGEDEAVASRLDALAEARVAARRAKDYARADDARTAMTGLQAILEDLPDGTTVWRRGLILEAGPSRPARPKGKAGKK